MNRDLLAFLIFSLGILTSCEEKTKEKSSLDTAKKDTMEKMDTIAQVKEPELTGKAGLIAKHWKAVLYKTPTQEFSGDLIDLIDIKFNFKTDYTFEYSEGEKKETGKWSIDTTAMKLTFEYTGEPKAEYEIKELKEDKLKISGKEHGIKRTFELAPQK